MKNEIELYHYSKNKFVFDKDRKYEQFNGRMDSSINPLKPDGLWLSDDSDFGWAEWCKCENFYLNHLQVRTIFLLDLKRIIVLTNYKDVKYFAKKYRLEREDFPQLENLSLWIRWNDVKNDYSGIFISPYHYDFWRFDFTWYYGWDCASACIWDLDAVKEYEELK